jgi:hypothetical protein
VPPGGPPYAGTLRLTRQLISQVTARPGHANRIRDAEPL